MAPASNPPMGMQVELYDYQPVVNTPKKRGTPCNDALVPDAKRVMTDEDYMERQKGVSHEYHAEAPIVMQTQTLHQQQQARDESKAQVAALQEQIRAMAGAAKAAKSHQDQKPSSQEREEQEHHSQQQARETQAEQANALKHEIETCSTACQTVNSQQEGLAGDTVREEMQVHHKQTQTEDEPEAAITAPPLQIATTVCSCQDVQSQLKQQQEKIEQLKKELLHQRARARDEAEATKSKHRREIRAEKAECRKVQSQLDVSRRSLERETKTVRQHEQDRDVTALRHQRESEEAAATIAHLRQELENRKAAMEAAAKNFDDICNTAQHTHEERPLDDNVNSRHGNANYVWAGEQSQLRQQQVMNREESVERMDVEIEQKAMLNTADREEAPAQDVQLQKPKNHSKTKQKRTARDRAFQKSTKHQMVDAKREKATASRKHMGVLNRRAEHSKRVSRIKQERTKATRPEFHTQFLSRFEVHNMFDSPSPEDRQQSEIAENMKGERLHNAMYDDMDFCDDEDTLVGDEEIKSPKYIPFVPDSVLFDQDEAAMKKQRIYDEAVEHVRNGTIDMVPNGKVYYNGSNTKAFEAVTAYDENFEIVFLSEKDYSPESILRPIPMDLKKEGVNDRVFNNMCLMSKHRVLQIEAAEQLLEPKVLKKFKARIINDAGYQSKAVNGLQITTMADFGKPEGLEFDVRMKQWTIVKDALIRMPKFENACRFYAEGEACENVCWPPSFHSTEKQALCTLYNTKDEMEAASKGEVSTIVETAREMPKDIAELCATFKQTEIKA